ncbi:MAG: Regulatory protein AtoC [Syntrophus sp. SKADARSKE-3]|nr:Regulatory protein AtoC [Syntrophus sp. SKADARSKE-3]
MARVLLINDDETFSRIICDQICALGHDCKCMKGIDKGLELALSENFDVVLLDILHPGDDGLSAIDAMRQGPSHPEVIILTGDGTADWAELAIRNGVWDYIVKPCSQNRVMRPLISALRYHEFKTGVGDGKTLKLDGILGRSQKMRNCFELIGQIASVDISAVIIGETGTGKELFARSIHKNSHRAGRDFVTVDCASLKESLAESILFGHERGAFTGAYRGTEGLICRADGGTLFLDEVGELPLSLQKNFLRVLQEQRYRPLGGLNDLRSDFRLIAATNRNLDAMVQEGTFREDLLFRMRSISLEIPPLRERKEDMGEIVIYHVTRICRQNGINLKGISPGFLDALCCYDWPGNVRELVNTIEKAIASALNEPVLFRQHLPAEIRIRYACAAIKDVDSNPFLETDMDQSEPCLPKLKELKEATYMKLEKKYLHDLIELTGGDIDKAMGISGLGRARLYGLLKKHLISPSSRVFA